jgi:WD40 repeat protein
MDATGKSSTPLTILDFAKDLEKLTQDFTGREWVFDEIGDWLSDPDGAPIFLLTGEPGVGKSAIAAQLVKLRSDIAAYHFCIAGRNETIIPGTVLHSLAAQLGEYLPGYGIALANTIKPTHLAINVNIDVERMTGGQIIGVVIKNLTVLDPQTELEVLLRAPLAAMPISERPILIVIDSLDEAATLRKDPTLVSLLSSMNMLPPWVRILCTSRPDRRVLRDFDQLNPYILAAESKMNLKDVRQYVTFRVRQPTLAKMLQFAGQGEAAFITHLAGAEATGEAGLVSGNFLFAKMLLNDIEAGQQSLANLEALPKSLDEVYHNFLRRFSTAEWEDHFQPIFGVLAVAQEPLVEEQIAYFSGQNRTNLRQNLGVVRQFLDVGQDQENSETFSLFHNSLRDYLLDEKRNQDFWCAPQDYHQSVSNYYLRTYKTGTNLKPWSECDLYGLRNLPLHLLDSCQKDVLVSLLTEYPWLFAKLCRVGITAMLADYDLAGDDPILHQVQMTLRQAAHVLSYDPKQLAGQLHGRLLGESAEEIQALLTQAASSQIGPWLRPLCADLRQPEALVRTLKGHTGWVNSIALTEDGTQAVSASSDKTLIVWNLQNGQAVRRLEGHTDEVNSVALTADGRYAVSASRDKTLIVWDVQRGQIIHRLVGHTSWVNGVALTADGQKAVSASSDKTLIIWNLQSGQAMRRLEGHTGSVNSVAITADGRRAVSASEDKTLIVWDLQSGQVIHRLKGHTSWVFNIALMPGGRQAISASGDKTLIVWDLENGQAIRKLEGHTDWVFSVALTSDGQQAISASSDNTLILWDLQSGQAVCRFEGHTGGVNSVALMPDGRHAISASRDETLIMWDMQSRQSLSGLEGHHDIVTFFTLTPNEQRVVSASQDKTLIIWDLKNNQAVRRLEGHSGAVTSVALTPDGRQAVSASWDKTLIVWDLMSGQVVRRLEGHTSSINNIVLTENGKQAISASDDKSLIVWDLQSGQATHKLIGHIGLVISLALTPDRQQVVSASNDRTLIVWDLQNGQVVRRLEGHIDQINCVALTSDGRLAVSASRDKSLIVWDLQSGQIVHKLEGHIGSVNRVLLTSDGRRAISASHDKTLIVWDLQSGQVMRRLEGHTGPIRDVALTPDNQQAISASEDKTLIVWDLQNGCKIASFETDEVLNTCVIAYDESTIIMGGVSGRVHFLRLEGVGN